MAKPKTIRHTKTFKKDYKRARRRGWDVEHLKAVMAQIVSGEPLARKYHEHPLGGKLKGYRECHIEPDFLLLWKDKDGVISFARIGTHSDIFDE